MSRPSLASLRQRIDSLDRDILHALGERGRCAQQIAGIKRQQTPADEPLLVYAPAREMAILKDLVKDNKGPLSAADVQRIFRPILAACRALQAVLRVHFLGPSGTYTEAAMYSHFGEVIDTFPLPTIETVFRAIEEDLGSYGVVPVENSAAGVVHHTLDRFVSSSLHICGEVLLPIHHCLLARPMDKLADIREVYAHPQSLAQCRAWLQQCPHIALTEVSSNAAAVHRVTEQEASAAIAAATNAEMHDLHILARNIEDDKDNTTRFLILGHQPADPSGEDKTSLLVSAADRPGALHHLLQPLAEHGISMSRLESRPDRSGMWRYLFFIDLLGHCKEAHMVAALAELERRSSLFRILGSYPRALSC